MVGSNLRALWAEPRPPHPPARVWRDRALVAVVVSWSVVETVLRHDLAWWRPLVLTVSLVIALALLWRRTHPLGAVAVAFGTLIAFDVARIFVFDETGLNSIAAVLVLPYSLFRWGAGREAAIGLGMILVWLPVTLAAAAADPAEVVAGYGFFLFSAALGTSIRYHAGARVRDIEQAKLRQRNQLARELHDTVGHHVSAIAIQAQAGRALAESHPDRALATLETIEEAASRTLEEMRAMVGVLRDGAEPDFAPHPGVAAIEQLARSVGGWPRVDVQLSGDLDDLDPSVGVALYRIAQEAVTNAVRHARHATRATVHVADEGERVRLTSATTAMGAPPVTRPRATASSAWPNERACSAAPSGPDPTPTAVGRSTRCCRKASRRHDHPRAHRRRPGHRPCRTHHDPRRPARHRRRR